MRQLIGRLYMLLGRVPSARLSKVPDSVRREQLKQAHYDALRVAAVAYVVDVEKRVRHE